MQCIPECRVKSYPEAISSNKFILEADSLESMHFKDCALDLFKLVGKRTLKHLTVNDSSVITLDVGEKAESLEVVDVSNFTLAQPKLYYMIFKSSNLRVLRLWDVEFDDDDDIIDLEAIAICLPNLCHLSLSSCTKIPPSRKVDNLW